MPISPNSSDTLRHVDATPPDAIVGIAAQAVGLVNVVGVTIGIGRASEHARPLARGELLCAPPLHGRNGNGRNALMWGGAHRTGSRQRTRQRGRKHQLAYR